VTEVVVFAMFKNEESTSLEAIALQDTFRQLGQLRKYVRRICKNKFEGLPTTLNKFERIALQEIGSIVVEFMQSKRKLSISTMITKNHADFIIAVMGNSIKCEKAGVRNLFLTPALRL